MPGLKTIRPSWVALVEIIHQLEKQPYHWPVERTIFQKIAYVATRQGLPILGMFRWLDVKPDFGLPVPEEESISA
ncbi:MAG: hypothetical protein HY695_09155 [Deltaproteobacteria bacterium]|nr:hypothetical protein [Deltaproteobacteria bacterium]